MREKVTLHEKVTLREKGLSVKRVRGNKLGDLASQRSFWRVIYFSGRGYATRLESSYYTLLEDSKILSSVCLMRSRCKVPLV